MCAVRLQSGPRRCDSSGQPAVGDPTSNAAGTLAYVLALITGIIFLVLEKY